MLIGGLHPFHVWLSPSPNAIQELMHEVQAQHCAVALPEPAARQERLVIFSIRAKVLEQVLLGPEGPAGGVVDVEGGVVREELDVGKREKAAVVVIVLVGQVIDLRITPSRLTMATERKFRFVQDQGKQVGEVLWLGDRVLSAKWMRRG
jgi:hypothetical protein